MVFILRMNRYLREFCVCPSKSATRRNNLNDRQKYLRFRLTVYVKHVFTKSTTASLVQRRMRILRRLYATNKEDYEKAMKILEIEKLEHIDPFKMRDQYVKDVRKQKFREECYQVN